jgi:hypothetical protein
MMTATETLHEECVDKLSPRNVKVSPLFHAMLGALLGQRWSKPVLVSLAITSDGYALGRREGDIGFNDFLGATDIELVANLKGVAECVGLSAAALAYMLNRVDSVRA